jgi:hypothetical protein
MRRQFFAFHLGALSMLAILGAAVVADSCAQAQTYGMQRRADRRGTRQEARQDKRECNATGESSRAGCRQMKRGERQEGRAERNGMTTTPGVTTQP